MNKEEFLKRLEQLLSDISEEERNDAIAFYRSYFEDAGLGNEASILKELESPEKVAEAIKANLGITERGDIEDPEAHEQKGEAGGENINKIDSNASERNNSNSCTDENTQVQGAEESRKKDEYEERLYGAAGYGGGLNIYNGSDNSQNANTGSNYSNRNTTGEAAGNNYNNRNTAEETTGNNTYYQNTGAYGAYGAPIQTTGKQEKKGGNKALWIVLAVVTSPVWAVLLVILAALMIAVLACVFALAVSIVAVMAALLFAGFMLAGVGIGYLFTQGVAVGLGLLGAGFLLLALGILAVWLVVWCFGWFVPWAVKGIVKLCKKPFEKKREREEE